LWTIVPRSVLGGAGYVSPSEKLTIACVGVGGMGAVDMNQVLSEQIVAVCDVDDECAARAAVAAPEATRYRDFREMLAVQKDLDAVMIATPDHAHAVITLAALRHGKHVYCQKPLTHSVHEALEVARVARETGRATQMGNQGQATEAARLVSEYIWAGALGTVREIHAWSNRRPDISPRGIPRPADTPPVPSHLDWDRWIGPAPLRPYHPCYHPFHWRGWWDFGTGVLGDIGCHNLSAAFKALKLGWPTSVEACSTHWSAPEEVRRETAPLASIVTFHFPATPDRPEVVVRWYDGGMMPPLPRDVEVSHLFDADGTLIVGDEGMLLGAKLLPQAKAAAFGKPPQQLERSPGHYQEWLNACKGGPPAGSNFVDHAGPLAATVLLGNIAIRAEDKLYWDADALRFRNSDAADALLQPPYRDGWTL
jgi:predicted dehydrogenase